MPENNQGITLCFPTVIQETMVENHAELNQSLIEAIKKLRATTAGTVPDTWSCELYTTLLTNSRLHRIPEFEPLVEHIHRNGEKLARQLRFKLGNNRLMIYECWVNICSTHHGQDIHNHANRLISGVYYVKVPPGAPGLLIRSPYEDTMIHIPVEEPNIVNTMIFEVPAVEGKMVCFRSFVKHSVRPNTTKGERISIAFNLTA